METRIYSRVIVALATALMVSCSGGGGGGSPFDPGTEPSTSTVPFLLDTTTRSLAHPAVTSSISDTVVRCAVMLREDEACTLTELPLLGMETTSPGVDDVMLRVVVTHDWMGTRFRDLLSRMPPEVLLMARGLTAVVISSEIRPSFYTTRTGAIYLDPEGMWLTQAEKDVISTAPDPRIADLEQLDFLMLWRYVQGIEDIRALPRNLDTLALRTAALLFHELAHANDFFPPDRLDQVDRTIPVYLAAGSNDIPSSLLAGTYPLMSSLMADLAGVAFRGVTPTPFQLAVSPDDVAAEFPSDVANDFYNYTTPREDLAIQFEEAMMLYTLGISRDVAVTNMPTNPQSCTDYVVFWGQRNRIAEVPSGVRSAFSVERILPEAADAVQAMLDTLAAPPAMLPGVDWCTNINLSSPPNAQTSLRLTVDPPVEGRVMYLRPYL
jgi:hypothetical protein